MISASPLYNAGATLEYHRDAFEAASRSFDTPEYERVFAEWGGRGAELAGLKGEVTREAFANTLEGRIAGEQIQHGYRDGEPYHRPGLDLTFAPDKSLSIESLVKGDRRIAIAHDMAVAKAMDFLEANGARVQRNSGEVATGNLIYAKFKHETARPAAHSLGDPHLHTHVVIINATNSPKTPVFQKDFNRDSIIANYSARGALGVGLGAKSSSLGARTEGAAEIAARVRNLPRGHVAHISDRASLLLQRNVSHLLEQKGIQEPGAFLRGQAPATNQAQRQDGTAGYARGEAGSRSGGPGAEAGREGSEGRGPRSGQGSESHPGSGAGSRTSGQGRGEGSGSRSQAGRQGARSGDLNHWHALDTQQLFVLRMEANQVYAEALYQQCKAFGMDVARGEYSPYIKGYTPEQLAEFSQRTKQIDARYAELGVAKHEACPGYQEAVKLGCREDKALVSREELRAHHRERAENVGIHFERGFDGRFQAQPRVDMGYVSAALERLMDQDRAKLDVINLGKDTLARASEARDHVKVKATLGSMEKAERQIERSTKTLSYQLSAALPTASPQQIASVIEKAIEVGKLHQHRGKLFSVEPSADRDQRHSDAGGARNRMNAERRQLTNQTREQASAARAEYAKACSSKEWKQQAEAHRNHGAGLRMLRKAARGINHMVSRHAGGLSSIFDGGKKVQSMSQSWSFAGGKNDHATKTLVNAGMAAYGFGKMASELLKVRFAAAGNTFAVAKEDRALNQYVAKLEQTVSSAKNLGAEMDKRMANTHRGAAAASLETLRNKYTKTQAALGEARQKLDTAKEAGNATAKMERSVLKAQAAADRAGSQLHNVAKAKARATGLSKAELTQAHQARRELPRIQPDKAPSMVAKLLQGRVEKLQGMLDKSKGVQSTLKTATFIKERTAEFKQALKPGISQRQQGHGYRQMSAGARIAHSQANSKNRALSDMSMRYQRASRVQSPAMQAGQVKHIQLAAAQMRKQGLEGLQEKQQSWLSANRQDKELVGLYKQFKSGDMQAGERIQLRYNEMRADAQNHVKGLERGLGTPQEVKAANRDLARIESNKPKLGAVMANVDKVRAHAAGTKRSLADAQRQLVTAQRQGNVSQKMLKTVKAKEAAVGRAEQQLKTVSTDQVKKTGLSPREMPRQAGSHEIAMNDRGQQTTGREVFKSATFDKSAHSAAAGQAVVQEPSADKREQSISGSVKGPASGVSLEKELALMKQKTAMAQDGHTSGPALRAEDMKKSIAAKGTHHRDTAMHHERAADAKVPARAPAAEKVQQWKSDLAPKQAATQDAGTARVKVSDIKVAQPKSVDQKRVVAMRAKLAPVKTKAAPVHKQEAQQAKQVQPVKAPTLSAPAQQKVNARRASLREIGATPVNKQAARAEQKAVAHDSTRAVKRAPQKSANLAPKQSATMTKGKSMTPTKAPSMAPSMAPSITPTRGGGPSFSR